jgi:predicted RNase H-like HicB family nuclease
LGIKGVVVGEGDTYEEALADVQSALRFHVESFGPEVIEAQPDVIEAFVAETAVDNSGPVSGRCPATKGPSGLRAAGLQNSPGTEQISMVRVNEDGSETPLTLPNHLRIKESTLRTVCSQAGIGPEDFLAAFRGSR